MTTTELLPAFYKKPRPLVAERDAKLALAEAGDYRFATGSNSVPVVATEFTFLCKHYPILFADGPVAQPVALLSLRNGENLFVGAKGEWRASYIPAYVRRYPFIFMENADRSEFTLCVDEAAPGIVKKGGRPLFEEGKPTELTNSALAFCRDYQAHHEFTLQFLAALQAADLLVENRADVTLADGQKLSLSGFRVIDEERFNKMPEDEFLRWRQNGWLHLVYCHFISTSNWGNLVDMTAEKAAKG